jgi:hypothetical protein
MRKLAILGLKRQTRIQDVDKYCILVVISRYVRIPEWLHITDIDHKAFVFAAVVASSRNHPTFVERYHPLDKHYAVESC